MWKSRESVIWQRSRRKVLMDVLVSSAVGSEVILAVSYVRRLPDSRTHVHNLRVWRRVCISTVRALPNASSKVPASASLSPCAPTLSHQPARYAI
jgi:hypothetical protein